MRSDVSELVSRIEGYNENKYEVLSIFKNDEGNYCVEIKVNPEKMEE